MNLKSLVSHHTVGHTLFGASLILLGVFNLVFTFMDSIVFGILAITALLSCLGCLLFVVFSHPEKNDEMSEAHLRAAYAEAYRINLIAMLFLLVVGQLSSLLHWDITVRLDMILPFLIGIGEFVVGVRFVRLEKEGE